MVVPGLPSREETTIQSIQRVPVGIDHFPSVDQSVGIGVQHRRIGTVGEHFGPVRDQVNVGIRVCRVCPPKPFVPIDQQVHVQVQQRVIGIEGVEREFPFPSVRHDIVVGVTVVRPCPVIRVFGVIESKELVVVAKSVEVRIRQGLSSIQRVETCIPVLDHRRGRGKLVRSENPDGTFAEHVLEPVPHPVLVRIHTVGIRVGEHGRTPEIGSVDDRLVIPELRDPVPDRRMSEVRFHPRPCLDKNLVAINRYRVRLPRKNGVGHEQTTLTCKELAHKIDSDRLAHVRSVCCQCAQTEGIRPGIVSQFLGITHLVAISVRIKHVHPNIVVEILEELVPAIDPVPVRIVPARVQENIGVGLDLRLVAYAVIVPVGFRQPEFELGCHARVDPETVGRGHTIALFVYGYLVNAFLHVADPRRCPEGISLDHILRCEQHAVHKHHCARHRFQPKIHGGNARAALRAVSLFSRERNHPPPREWRIHQFRRNPLDHRTRWSQADVVVPLEHVETHQPIPAQNDLTRVHPVQDDAVSALVRPDIDPARRLVRTEIHDRRFSIPYGNLHNRYCRYVGPSGMQPGYVRAGRHVIHHGGHYRVVVEVGNVDSRRPVGRRVRNDRRRPRVGVPVPHHGVRVELTEIHVSCFVGEHHAESARVRAAAQFKIALRRGVVRRHVQRPVAHVLLDEHPEVRAQPEGQIVFHPRGIDRAVPELGPETVGMGLNVVLASQQAVDLVRACAILDLHVMENRPGQHVPVPVHEIRDGIQAQHGHASAANPRTVLVTHVARDPPSAEHLDVVHPPSAEMVVNGMLVPEDRTEPETHHQVTVVGEFAQVPDPVDPPLAETGCRGSYRRPIVPTVHARAQFADIPVLLRLVVLQP